MPGAAQLENNGGLFSLGVQGHVVQEASLGVTGFCLGGIDGPQGQEEPPGSRIVALRRHGSQGPTVMLGPRLWP